MFLCVGLIIFNMGMIYKIQIWDACLCYENTLGLGLYLGSEDILLMALYLALHFRSKIFCFYSLLMRYDTIFALYMPIIGKEHLLIGFLFDIK